MKKFLQLPVVALCAFSLWSMSSCKKDENDPVCRIKTVTDATGSSTSLLTLAYNSDGKLSSVMVPGTSGYSRLFTYSGNSINVIEKDALGSTTGSYDVTLNSNGKITTILEKSATGTLENTMTVAYDASGNASSFTSTPASGTPTVQVITFANGNLKTITDGSSTTTLDYYTDKAFMDGDYLKLQQMIQYGALYVSNANLLKTITPNSGTGSTITYDYDETGKISKATINSGSSTEVVTYTYECN